MCVRMKVRKNRKQIERLGCEWRKFQFLIIQIASETSSLYPSSCERCSGRKKNESIYIETINGIAIGLHKSRFAISQISKWNHRIWTKCGCSGMSYIDRVDEKRSILR